MDRPLRVSGLGVYPVKSLRGLSVPRAHLERWGFRGDRRWMVVDARGRFVTQRTTPRMSLVRGRLLDDGRAEISHPDVGPVVLEPSGEPVSVRIWQDVVEAEGGDPDADAWLSALLGRTVRLVHLADPSTAREIDRDYAGPGEPVTFADGFPLLVTTTASLAALNTWQQAAGARAMTMARFRPSLVVDTDEAWAEDRWAVLRVGDVELRLVKPCARCVMTAVEPGSGVILPGGPLRQLGAHRPGVSFGINAIPATTGTLHLGDAVEVLATHEGLPDVGVHPAVTP